MDFHGFSMILMLFKLLGPVAVRVGVRQALAPCIGGPQHAAAHSAATLAVLEAHKRIHIADS